MERKINKQHVADAISVLDKDSKGVHVNKIAEQMYSTPAYHNFEGGLEALIKSVNGYLGRDVKSKNGIFARVVGKRNNKTGKISYKKGLYKLKPQPKEQGVIRIQKNPKSKTEEQGLLFPELKINSRKIKNKKKQDVDVFTINTEASKTHIGKGGEFAVISELLYRGLYAVPAIVDDGVDVIAYKKDKVFLIQVKTTIIEKGQFKFSIKKDSFIRYDLPNMFYVFVCRYTDAQEAHYIIFPSAVIKNHIDNGYISVTENTYEVKINVGSRLTLSSGVDSVNIKGNLNKFDLIK